MTDTKSKEVELLPCPFCGHEVKFYYAGTSSFEVYAESGGCLICAQAVLINCSDNNIFSILPDYMIINEVCVDYMLYHNKIT